MLECWSVGVLLAAGVVPAGRVLVVRDVPLLYVHLAGLPSQPGVLALAAEHVDAVRALSVANVELAVSALVAGGAGTAGVVDLVQAGGAVEEGGGSLSHTR